MKLFLGAFEHSGKNVELVSIIKESIIKDAAMEVTSAVILAGQNEIQRNFLDPLKVDEDRIKLKYIPFTKLITYMTIVMN